MQLTRVVGVLSEVVDVDIDLSTRDEHLQFIVVERSQPVYVDHIVQTTAERLDVRPDLQPAIEEVSKRKYLVGGVA